MDNRVKLLFSIISILFITSCQEREARLPVSVNSGVDYTESITLSKKINQREERQFRKYIEKQDLKFERSSFGFLYHVTSKSNNSIQSGDEVQYTETVEGLDGQIIYTVITRSVIVDHQDEIKGMHEGLKLMSNESEAIFIFPSHQAFGFHGDDKKVKSNTPLVYRIKVLKVKNNQINN